MVYRRKGISNLQKRVFRRPRNKIDTGEEQTRLINSTIAKMGRRTKESIIVRRPIGPQRIITVPSPPPMIPEPEPEPVVQTTRRSLRNQQRGSSGRNSVPVSRYSPEPSPINGNRKRRFLKETTLKSPSKQAHPKPPPLPQPTELLKKTTTGQNTANALNRMVTKRVNKEGNPPKPQPLQSRGRRMKQPMPKKKLQKVVFGVPEPEPYQIPFQNPAFGRLPPALTPAPSLATRPVPEPGTILTVPKKRGRKKRVDNHNLPNPLSLVQIKLESQETEEQEEDYSELPEPNDESDTDYVPDEPIIPKKRGRKRKVDAMLTPKTEAIPSSSAAGLTMQNNNSNLSAKQKRGRQSVQTEAIKPRFPFCTFCLSKAPPRDYIINHMSFPNEYQRMRRLFVYIYKDLKFPFMPFDLERENVFDYCDLPLCDNCIVLYKELYVSYTQIETAKEQLKLKVERMVKQIQDSDKDSELLNQLKSIKNSPDPLMNKYHNFRRRFSTYRPGDSRADSDAVDVVPASIARIRIINPVPKRTNSTQTLLTMANLPPPTPPPVPDVKVLPANKDTESAPCSNTVGESKSKVTNEGPSTSTVSNTPDNVKPTIVSSDKPKGATSPVITLPEKNKKEEVSALTASTPPLTNSKPSLGSKITSPALSTGASILIGLNSPKKPLIIAKTSVFSGTPITKQSPSTSSSAVQSNVNKPAAVDLRARAVASSLRAYQPNVAKSVVIKDEPEDLLDLEPESDHFLETNASQNSAASESSSSNDQSDNVFRKHKKLRVLKPNAYTPKTSDASETSANCTPKHDKEKTDENNIKIDKNAAESDVLDMSLKPKPLETKAKEVNGDSPGQGPETVSKDKDKDPIEEKDDERLSSNEKGDKDESEESKNEVT